MKFKNIFKNKNKLSLLPKDKNDVSIVHVNDTSVILHETLGISDDRAIEISKMLNNYANKSTDSFNTLECIKEISKQLIHPNELFFASYQVGRYCESLNSSKNLLETLKKFKL